MGEKYVFLTL